MAADTDAFVFNDAEGHYYVVPREVIERGIISDESKERVEASLADTTGFMLSEHTFSFVGPLRLSAESQNVRDSANAIRLAPNPAAASATQRPRPWTPARDASTSAPVRAPRPEAPISRPSPRGPPCKIRSAKIGIRVE